MYMIPIEVRILVFILVMMNFLDSWILEFPLMTH